MRMVWIAALAAYGCHEPDPPPPAPVAAQAAPAPQPARTPPAPLPAHSTWRGLYHCAQGITGVTLTMDVEADALSAVFAFEAVDATPTVPTGSYWLRGSVTRAPDGGFVIELVPVAWIVQPPRYFMVGISARSDAERRVLRGRITDPSCSTIEVTRLD
jgi:hypothetical protein